jgi:hypothetical protein
MNLGRRKMPIDDALDDMVYLDEIKQVGIINNQINESMNYIEENLKVNMCIIDKLFLKKLDQRMRQSEIPLPQLQYDFFSDNKFTDNELNEMARVLNRNDFIIRIINDEITNGITFDIIEHTDYSKLYLAKAYNAFGLDLRSLLRFDEYKLSEDSTFIYDKLINDFYSKRNQELLKKYNVSDNAGRYY